MKGVKIVLKNEELIIVGNYILKVLVFVTGKARAVPLDKSIFDIQCVFLKVLKIESG